MIDLNSDVGESFGPYTLGDDARVLAQVTSANVACGFHAGDPIVMRATVRLAKAHGVAVGAHPGYRDLVAFGRRDMAATPEEIKEDLIYQVGALWALARCEGVKLSHVKPHGALYNRAARDYTVARAIAEALVELDLDLVLIGLAGSRLCEAGREVGLKVAGEAFADRAYNSDGCLVPRSAPGAVITNPEEVTARAVLIAKDRVVKAVDGTVVDVDAETICLHGDTKDAADLAVAVRKGLSDAGISVSPLLDAMARPE